ncbi:hypothetical protein [Lactiplantibacillus xiangfangensis]|uniref:hypothetical protein n=1 Tax=Lactiplantibacillus xiangfangensis TaxID=942150 RepID=UPI00384C38C6
MQVDESIEALTPAFDRSTGSNNYKLIQLLLNPEARQKSEMIELSRMRDIGFAKGKFLDRIGRLVGEYRGGQSDDEFYRSMIKSRIARQHTDGTVNQLYKIICDTLGCKPSAFRIMPLWNVTGEPNAIRILNIPFDAIDDQSKVKILIGRLQKSTAATVRIDSLTFKDKTTSNIYVGTYTKMSAGLVSKGVQN